MTFLLLATALTAPLALGAPPPYPPPAYPPPAYSGGADGYGSEVLSEEYNPEPDYKPVPDYVPAPYEPDLYLTSDYGQAKPNCHFENKVVFKDKCLDYEEKICYSQNVEKCANVPYRNCTGTIKTEVDRVCFNVDELICGLKEKVDFDTLQEEYSVQLCTVVKDRICDTTYNIEVNTVDDFQCCNVENQFCEDEEVIIDDVTCKETSDFVCEKKAPTEGYGPKITVCRPVPIKNCYKTPRTIRKEHCRPDTHRFCQKFTNNFPHPVESQNCHFEAKKVCEIQRRTRERKAKRYSYSQDCKVVPREVCDQQEKHSVAPACTTEERLKCTYEPEEKCNKENKKYCYKEEQVEKVEVCDEKFSTNKL